MKTYYLETVFTFGKHEGMTLDQVASTDPDYIMWCIKNLDHFFIAREDLTALSTSNPKFLLMEDVLKAYEAKEQSIANEAQPSNVDDYSDDDDYPSVYDSEYYDSNLDMDQQSMEFWNEIG